MRRENRNAGWDFRLLTLIENFSVGELGFVRLRGKIGWTRKEIFAWKIKISLSESKDLISEIAATTAWATVMRRTPNLSFDETEIGVDGFAWEIFLSNSKLHRTGNRLYQA